MGTTNNEESLVYWGETTLLGDSTIGDAFTNTGTFQIHDVELIGLDPNTRYFYQTVTGSLESEIYNFKTSTDVGDESSTRLVAMSDMQRDYSNPNKYEEIVNDGILSYFGINENTDFKN